MNKLLAMSSLSLAVLITCGCGRIHNHFAADSPAELHPNASPTSEAIRAKYEPDEQRKRDWELVTIEPVKSDVIHGPLYFEDPLVAKGASYKNRLGWEDFVAPPYDIARFTLNWVACPISAIVTPPWQPMVSDGKLSEQLLGPDHDAERSDGIEAELHPEQNFTTIKQKETTDPQ